MARGTAADARLSPVRQRIPPVSLSRAYQYATYQRGTPLLAIRLHTLTQHFICQLFRHGIDEEAITGVHHCVNAHLTEGGDNLALPPGRIILLRVNSSACSSHSVLGACRSDSSLLQYGLSSSECCAPTSCCYRYLLSRSLALRTVTAPHFVKKVHGNVQVLLGGLAGGLNP